MTFATLALIAVIGVLGPLLALPKGWHLPIVLGELIAGIAFGATGFNRLHAQNTTFTLLADIGFALVMFVAGSHVPVRDASMRTALRTGVLRAVGIGVVSVPLALLISHGFGTGHTALYAVLMSSSSAALVLPIVDSLGLGGPDVVAMLPQVAVADAACIVALPLAIDPAHAARAGLGALAVIGCAIVVFLALRYGEQRGYRQRLDKVSEERSFALELRISLAILFALAAVATQTHVSIMLAGFTFGIAVAGIGEPRRLASQLFAMTEGFFGPLFFVWLGASLNLRDLGSHPSYILLGVVLGVAAVVAHAAMRLTRQPIAIGALASAQLGVPVAAATLGSQLHLLKPGEPAALILGALITISVATLAGGRVVSKEPTPAAAAAGSAAGSAAEPAATVPGAAVPGAAVPGATVRGAAGPAAAVPPVAAGPAPDAGAQPSLPPAPPSSPPP
jgi:Kef-type K+ transport system membrane component KefB